ncbi:FAD-dependent oxidoreductase [soil metagenome]
MVVGAGLAGLVAATELAATRRTVLVDKGRGPGGRLATRRIGEAVFDHGAQFLTARDPDFLRLVQRLGAEGVAVPWFDRLPSDAVGTPERTRFRGAPGMNAVAKALAAALDVRCSAQVASVAAEGGRWRIALVDGSTIHSSSVLLTSPVPQSLALLDAGAVVLAPGDRRSLEAVTYDPCLAVLAALEGPSGLAAPGARRPEHPDLGWVADNRAKGISPVPAVTLHASADYSRDHFDAPEDDVVAALLGAAELASAPVAGSTQLVRWRYAKPARLHAEPFLAAQGLPALLFAGDGFGGPRVEGAWASGQAVARHLLASRPAGTA